MIGVLYSCVPADAASLTRAEVAELADALASGASPGNRVEVRVLSSAPTYMANVPVTRIPDSTPADWIVNFFALVLVLLAVPVGLVLVGAPLALLIRGVIEVIGRMF